MAAALAAVLSSCAAIDDPVKIEPEAFGSTTTHSRSFAATPSYTCEAARRALLSQGFVITQADAEIVKGRKYFQPEPETHVELEFNVVCASDGPGGRHALAFVNALQDRYALKKSNNSASLGVGALGSLSLPFSSSDDSLVKVASETITSAPFYGRFFALLGRYLLADSDLLVKPLPQVIRPAPAPTAPAPAAPASAAAPGPVASSAAPAASAASAA
jgi:hypothetical protein